MAAYYNEHDAETAAWLQNNIDAGLVAPGTVDTRSITEVQPDDLRGFTQHHFFAGIGGWSLAARLAGWPDDRPLWSGSCPCQPYSAAGKGLGVDDPRHLWPDLYRLWRAHRPPVGVGEQVAGSAGYGWFDGVRADLAREGVACRVVDIPALAVDAPHQRNRLYWVAVADANASRELEREEWREGVQPHGRERPLHCHGSGTLVDASRLGWRKGQPEPVLHRGWATSSVTDRADGGVGDRGGARSQGQPVAPGLEGAASRGADAQRATGRDGGHARRNGSWWAGADWIQCHDVKARRVADASAPLLAHGFPNRILAWRGLGNAIVPPLAAEVLGALMDVLDGPERLAA